MSAQGSYNPATDILTVTGDGLPHPVAKGTFPNENNLNDVSAQTFRHAVTFRGVNNSTAGGSVPLGIV